MGMAFYVEPEKRKARKGMAICEFCDCEYSVNTKWCRGYNVSKGTATPRFVKIEDIEHGRCPSCNKKAT